MEQSPMACFFLEGNPFQVLARFSAHFSRVLLPP